MALVAVPSFLHPAISTDNLARCSPLSGPPVAHFEDALAFCRKAGYRPELARSCCDYGELLLQRKGPGDQAKAMSLLEESLSICQELGMRPLMERAAALQERAASQPARAPAYPGRSEPAGGGSTAPHRFG